MAVFMLSENQTICIQATEISHNDGYVVAWYGEDVVAMFRASEIIGCWLDKERSIKMAGFEEFLKEVENEN